ncbi:Histone-lysine N-methyltransferase ASH1L, partial [Araneus ventricosus]
SVAKKSSSSKKSRSREVKEYVPEDHDFGLMPPPIHVGRYLREKRSEYKLPFDLWWLYKNKQLVYNDELANNYKKIRTNVYVDIKPDSKNEDHQPCMCCPPKDGRRKGCGMECLNRMMYVECIPQLCPCKDMCSNQRFAKHEWSPGLERFMTKNRGWGIRTTEFIRTGAGGYNSESSVSYGLHQMFKSYVTASESSLSQQSVPLADQKANSEAMLLGFGAEKSL